MRRQAVVLVDESQVMAAFAGSPRRVSAISLRTVVALELPAGQALVLTSGRIGVSCQAFVVENPLE